MKELINPELAQKVMLGLAVAGPVIGLIAGALMGLRERQAARKTVTGALIGGLLTVVYGLWLVYGAITNALGLDSVLNLALQLVLFAVFGVFLGLIIYRVSIVLKRPEAEK